MIKAEQIVDILKNHGEEISNIEIHPDGFVQAHLNNRIDTTRPYYFIVDPIEKDQTFRLCVLPIMKVRSHDSKLYPLLARANCGLRFGCVGVNPNNEIMFTLNYLDTGENQGPSRDIIDRLLQETLSHIRLLERVILRGAMADAGIPQNRIEEIVKEMLGSIEENSASSEVTL